MGPINEVLEHIAGGGRSIWSGPVSAFARLKESWPMRESPPWLQNLYGFVTCLCSVLILTGPAFGEPIPPSRFEPPAPQCTPDRTTDCGWCLPEVTEAPDWGDRRVITLKGDYHLTQYRPSGLSAENVFDARGARWIVNNCGVGGVGNRNRDLRLGPGANRYPVLIEHAPRGVWIGGVVTSHIPQDTFWDDQYCNSAGLTFRDVDFAVDGVRVDGAWDGVRFSSETEEPSHSLLQHGWLSNIRDDAVENDKLTSLTIRDTLFDGVFTGISIDPASGYSGPDHYETGTLLLDRVLMRVQSYPYRENDGRETVRPGSFIKGHFASPAVEIYDSIFAFDTPSSGMNHRMTTIFNSKLTSCADNMLLWMSDEAFPNNFPQPPGCFTIVTGAEARRIWERARADWINRHPEVGRVAGDPWRVYYHVWSDALASGVLDAPSELDVSLDYLESLAVNQVLFAVDGRQIYAGSELPDRRTAHPG